MREVKLSVIICIVNNLAGLRRCVGAILSGNLRPAEIIVVHAGDSVEVQKFVESLPTMEDPASCRSLYLKSEKSLVRQRNVGINHASGDVVCFIDDDAIPDKDFLRLIAQFFGSRWNDTIGGVQGTVDEHKAMKDTLASFFRKMFMLSHLNGDGRMQKSGYPSFLQYFPEPRLVEVFNGCQMCFKRDILLKDQFDMNFKDDWYGDDYELSYRLSRQYALYQLPDARISHLSSSTTPEDLRKIWAMQVPNHMYVFKKFFSGRTGYRRSYYVSFVGDMLSAISQSIRYGSASPITGWWLGVKTLVKNRGEIYRERS
jgi:glycosyltransferase involved in cell wall biosynthesis